MKVLSRLLCLVLCLPLLVMGQDKITWNKDGSQMALIPAGSFEMGDHFNQGREDGRELVVWKWDWMMIRPRGQTGKTDQASL